MAYDRRLASTWQLLLDSICTTMGALGTAGGSHPPIVLSSLPDLPYARDGRDGPAPLTFIQSPPGRTIAMAIGLRAARPHTPLVLVMNADSVTLGTNHLIHAARRNVGMTVLLLRSDLTQHEAPGTMDRAAWGVPARQQRAESPTRPLEWATALEAALVGRADIQRPDELAALLTRAVQTPGFSLIGVTADPSLPTGVLSRCEAPEYFAAYRTWAAPLRLADDAAAGTSAAAPPAHQPTRAVPRLELRIAGLGGQGVKLAGSVLSEAAGLHEGLWATQRGDYGSATRGGPSMVDVVIGSDPITYPNADHPDVLVLLTQAAAVRHAAGARSGAVVIADPGEVGTLPEGAVAVPIAVLARTHTGKPLAAGIVAAGCAAAATRGAIGLEALERGIAEQLPAALVAANVAACRAGHAATLELLQERVT